MVGILCNHIVSELYVFIKILHFIDLSLIVEIIEYIAGQYGYYFFPVGTSWDFASFPIILRSDNLFLRYYEIFCGSTSFGLFCGVS